MKPDKVFKRYDVRGKYPEELNEDFVQRMGKSVGFFAKENYNRKVVVCRDTKESSETLKDSLIQALKNQGIEIIDIGVGPTDMASFHCMKQKCVGVQVTSSHMPLNFNGLKFIYPEGNGFVNKDLNQLQNLFGDNEFDEKEHGEVDNKDSGAEEYREELAQFITDNFELEERKVVVETMGGAGADFLPEVLRRLGFNVVNMDPGGKPYRDPPNPTSENLDGLKQTVEDEDAYIGLALDLDADRIAAYFDGDWISGDDLFCVFAQIFDGEAVASVDTATKLEDFAEKVYYTRVGDPFVIDETTERDAVLSGEPNGHYCFPEFTNYNSGILSGLILASCDLEDLLDNIPESFVAEDSIEYSSRESAEQSLEKFKEYVDSNFDVLSQVDGVKFRKDGSAVLARLSGSSPKIRLKVQSQESIVEGVLDEIQTVFSEDINP